MTRGQNVWWRNLRTTSWPPMTGCERLDLLPWRKLMSLDSPVNEASATRSLRRAATCVLRLPRNFPISTEIAAALVEVDPGH
jgi:hypothetical protein